MAVVSDAKRQRQRKEEAWVHFVVHERRVLPNEIEAGVQEYPYKGEAVEQSIPRHGSPAPLPASIRHRMVCCDPGISLRPEVYPVAASNGAQICQCVVGGSAWVYICACGRVHKPRPSNVWRQSAQTGFNCFRKHGVARCHSSWLGSLKKRESDHALAPRRCPRHPDVREDKLLDI